MCVCVGGRVGVCEVMSGVSLFLQYLKSLYFFSQAAEKDAFKKDDLKKHRKMDIGKGRVSSRDKGQSLGRKRPPPGREMSDDQQPAVKKQKCTLHCLPIFVFN